jgi:hypothetical protein
LLPWYVEAGKIWRNPVTGHLRVTICIIQWKCYWTAFQATRNPIGQKKMVIRICWGLFFYFPNKNIFTLFFTSSRDITLQILWMNNYGVQTWQSVLFGLKLARNNNASWVTRSDMYATCLPRIQQTISEHNLLLC